VSESPEDVEESSVAGAGQGTLTVGRQSVRGDALGSRAAYMRTWLSVSL
jgi:hypothetical protein